MGVPGGGRGGSIITAPPPGVVETDSLQVNIFNKNDIVTNGLRAKMT